MSDSATPKDIMRAAFLVLLLLSACQSDSGPPTSIMGVASVIDGDTIDIHGQPIRLYGIDAPEKGQRCGTDQWRCGQTTALALADRIGQGTVACEVRDIDRYQRLVAACHNRGGDLNGWMVGQGHAVAYRRYASDYVQQEKFAKNASQGIWSGPFVMPWDWRQGKR